MLSDTGTPNSTPAQASPAPDSVTVSDSDAGAGPLVNAGKTALGKVPGGTVTSIDAERGGTRWEVEVVTANGIEHKVYVSRDGATALSGPRTDDTDSEDRSENLREVRAAKLDYEAAAAAILAARGGTLTELNLDDHQGTIVWEADVQQSTTRYEVAIDAGSGDVVRNHRSNDEED